MENSFNTEQEIKSVMSWSSCNCFYCWKLGNKLYLWCLLLLLLYPTFLLGQSESVRDVQFSMKDYFTFAASFENGNVQLWDIRRPDRYERMFTAHTGPVFCCDWHPDDR